MNCPVTLVLALVALALGGCQERLMPTPNVYASGKYQLYGDLDPSLRTSKVDVLYVTDRAPIQKKGRLAGYGYGPSRSLAFGSCVVEIGRDVSWETLLKESTQRKRIVSLPLRVRSVSEMGRFPHTPWPLVSPSSTPATATTPKSERHSSCRRPTAGSWCRPAMTPGPCCGTCGSTLS